VIGMNRGQLVIAGIFGIALLAAGFSMWFRYVQTREVLEFWGADAVALITSPDRVELWELEPMTGEGPAEETAQRTTVGETTFIATATRIVTKAPGFTNARHALTVKRSFQWNVPACTPDWSHALVFSRDGRQKTVVFSLNEDCQVTQLADGDKTAGIAPIAEGLATLFAEQLGS